MACCRYTTRRQALASNLNQAEEHPTMPAYRLVAKGNVEIVTVLSLTSYIKGLLNKSNNINTLSIIYI